MNYGGPQDQRYGGGQSLTDGYDYDGEKNYYGQQGQQQLPSFPSFSNMRGTQQPPSHPYHGGLHQSSPSLLSERVLPPMSSVARGPSSMSAGGSDMGVSALSAAAAAHQMSRLGEAFKDSLVHQMGKSSSSPSGSLGPGPSSYGLAQQQPYGLSTSGHSDRLYGGSANPFPNHGGALSGSSGSLSEKSSPRSSTQRSSGEAGYGLPTVTTRGSGDRGVQLPAPSISTQLGANGAAHQAAVSLSHIASGAGSQLHPSSTSVSTQQQQQPTAGRTAASMNPKDLLELYSKWDQLDNKAKSKNEEVHAEEVRKERHNMAEKRRRSDMNGAIERLKTLLPQQVTNDRRLTKVEVLTEAADHLTQVQNLCAKLITENKRLKALVPGVKMEDDDAFLTRGNDDDAASANNATVPTSDSSGSGREGDAGDDVSSHEDERRPATADERCSDGGDFGEGQQPSAKRLRRSSPGDSSAGSGSDSNGSGREGDAGASSSSESASTDNQQRHNNIVGAPHSRHNSVGSDSQQSGSGGDDGRGERDGEGPVRVPSDDDGRTPHLHHHVIDEGVEGRDSDNSNDGIPTASTSKRRRTTSGAAADQGEPTTFANLHFPSSATSSTPSTSSSTSSSLSSSSSAAEMSAASAYGHHYHHQPQQQQQHYGGGAHHHLPQQQHYGGSGLGQHQQQPHPYHHHPQHHM